MRFQVENMVFGVLALCSALIFCACAGSMKIVKISELSADPNKFIDEEVTVKGKLVESYAIPQNLIKIDDGSGDLWVLSQILRLKQVDSQTIISKRSGDLLVGTSRAEEQKITVTGKVKIGLTLANMSFGVILIEKEPK